MGDTMFGRFTTKRLQEEVSTCREDSVACFTQMRHSSVGPDRFYTLDLLLDLCGGCGSLNTAGFQRHYLSPQPTINTCCEFVTPHFLCR